METGAYTLGTLGAGGVPVTPPVTHNGGSQIWLPTENEWYKAAYYAGGGSYNLYPTSSSAITPATGRKVMSVRIGIARMLPCTVIPPLLACRHGAR